MELQILPADLLDQQVDRYARDRGRCDAYQDPQPKRHRGHATITDGQDHHNRNGQQREKGRLGA
ncbi:hypothetical protein [Streptomyces sp. NPDC054804]